MLMTLKNWWYRFACLFIGHSFSPWTDAYDGSAQRGCARCFRIERAPYMDVWREARRKAKSQRNEAE
jgi:hypothetical protein